MSLLRLADTHPPFALLDALREHVARLGSVRDVHLLLIDYAEQTLVQARRVGPRLVGDPYPVDRSEAGRAFLTQQILTRASEGVHCVYAPVTVRAERLGVLAVELVAEPDHQFIRQIMDVSVDVAYILLSARRYTDCFEQLRRRQDLELPAEIQWELLPVLAYDSEEFSLAGSLEPAYEIGGDTFDYATDAAALTVSVTDAMGHGLRAAVLSSLATAAQRNARRRQRSLLGQVEAVNAALHSQFGGEAFVTEFILRFDLATGGATVVNAGHPVAYRMRGLAIDDLSVDPDIPLGLFPGTPFHEHQLHLQAGDRFILITDGVLETRPDSGEPFGVSRLRAVLSEVRDARPYEVTRRLTQAVLRYRGGSLRDDVTVVCIDWRGRPPHG